MTRFVNADRATFQIAAMLPLTVVRIVNRVYHAVRCLLMRRMVLLVLPEARWILHCLVILCPLSRTGRNGFTFGY